MLVLSRQRDESVFIGGNIKVTVVDIRGDKVRLGFEAPEEIPVHRKEVFDAIQRDNQRLREEIARLEEALRLAAEDPRKVDLVKGPLETNRTKLMKGEIHNVTYGCTSTAS